MTHKSAKSVTIEVVPEDVPDELAERLAGLLPDDQLHDALKGLGPDQITGPGGLLAVLAGRVVNAALEGELTDHLGYPAGQAPRAGRAITATDRPRRPSRPIWDRSRSRPRAIARARLTRDWWPSARPGWRA